MPATRRRPLRRRVAAISARQALAAADPQPTASISDGVPGAGLCAVSAERRPRANIVAASAPIPPIRPARAHTQSAWPSTRDRHRRRQGRTGPGAARDQTSRATGRGGQERNDAWMRAMILAPSASRTMSATVLGDPDMTLMRVYFVKPQPQRRDELLGRSADGHHCDSSPDRLSRRLTTTSFVMRTASLR